MLSKIKAIYRNNMTIANNFGFLMLLQMSNYALPLIVEPYLIRTLGAQNYGKLSFSQLFMGWMILVVSYGFDLTATRKIAINREKIRERSIIFYRVMFSKLIIFILVTIGFVLININIEQFTSESVLHYNYYLMVFGMLLFPVWFFQGMQDMKYITYFNISIRIISTIFIFILINSNDQYELVALIRGGSYFVVGIVSLVLAIMKFKMMHIDFSIKGVLDELKEGFSIFWSTIIVSFYRIVPAFIIGFFYSYEIVGYYNLVDKIIKMFVGLLDPLKKAIFPHFSMILKEDKVRGIGQANRIIKVMTILSSLFCLILILFADKIIYIMTGGTEALPILLLRILSLLPIIVNIAGILGTQLMINLGYSKEFTRIISISGILSLVLLIVFVPVFGAVGASIIVVITELIIMLGMFRVLKKYKVI